MPKRKSEFMPARASYSTTTSYLGRILAQRARIAKAQKDHKAAGSLFDRAVEEHKKALQANSESRIDRLLQKSVSQERATLH